MLKMKAPRGNKSGASYDGKFYPVEKGFVTVPDEAVEALQNHGFAPEDADEEKGK